jgi:hypothetical protein
MRWTHFSNPLAQIDLRHAITRRRPTGLVYVPDLVRDLEDRGVSVAETHAALLKGARNGWLEARPDSSVGRLLKKDRLLMLDADGQRIAYVRVRGGTRTPV